MIDTFRRQKALAKVESLHFQHAESINTVDAYKQYLQLYPSGSYRQAALANIDTIHFRTAESDHTMHAYREYLSKYPSVTSTIKGRIETL